MTPYRLAAIFLLATAAFALIRFLVLAVFRTHPALFAFLGFQACQAALIVGVTPRSHVYSNLYVLIEPVNWIFYFLVVRELYDRVFAAFPGIRGSARFYVNVCTGLALVVSWIMVSVAPPSPLGAAFTYVLFWGKFTSFALAVFILTMIFLVSRYPVEIARNEAVSIVLLTCMFFGDFLVLRLLGQASSSAMLIRNYALLVLSSLCFLAWGVLIRTPERSQVRKRPAGDDGEARRLIEQLALIDSLLLKSGSRIG